MSQSNPGWHGGEIPSAAQWNYLWSIKEDWMNALPKDGSVPMTGFLTLFANPVSDFQAATKQYVDSVAGGGYILPAATSTTLGGVMPDGTTIINTGGAIAVRYGTLSNTAAQGNDTRIVNALSRTGDAMTAGYLTLANTPVNAMHAATKQYVDVRTPALADVAVVATIASLRAATTTTLVQNVVWVDGYASVNDGGEGIFCYKSTDLISSDNGGTIIVDASGRRWFRDLGAGDKISVRWFGAKGDGTTDDHTAIAATVAFVSARKGGTVWFPASAQPYCTTQMIEVTTSAVKLAGAGKGGWHDYPIDFAHPAFVDAPSRIKWTGASGGASTLLKIHPPAGSVQNLQDNGIWGLFFEGNFGGCDYGVTLLSTNHGFYDIRGQEFAISMIYTGVDPGLWALYPNCDYGDLQSNAFWIDGRQVHGTGALLVCTGFTASPNGANTSGNTFHKITGIYKNTDAVQIYNADTNVFERIVLFRFPGGAGRGVVLFGTDSADAESDVARWNVFLLCNPGAGGLHALGTSTYTTASVGNAVYRYDIVDGAPAPAIDTGATLFWSDMEKPQGFRRYAINTVGAVGEQSFYIDSGGRVVQWGLCDSVSALSNITIDLGIHMAGPTNDIVVCVTPLNNACAHVADCTLTQLIIGNADASFATRFYWRVEGLAA